LVAVVEVLSSLFPVNLEDTLDFLPFDASIFSVAASKSSSVSFVNFKIIDETINDTIAANNTPIIMCKNSPLGAFNIYTINRSEERRVGKEYRKWRTRT